MNLWTVLNSSFASIKRPLYEITISTLDNPKLLFQLTSLLSEIGLNIQEAHAFSTKDGNSLDVFVVDGWGNEESDQLRSTLLKEISNMEAPSTRSASHRLTTIKDHLMKETSHIHISVH